MFPGPRGTLNIQFKSYDNGSLLIRAKSSDKLHLTNSHKKKIGEQDNANEGLRKLKTNSSSASFPTDNKLFIIFLSRGLVNEESQD